MTTKRVLIRIGMASLLIMPCLTGASLVAPQGSGWVLLDGPRIPGGIVDAIAVAPSATDTVYALMQGEAGERLFRSWDAALSWQSVYTFSAAVRVLAVDPTDSAVVYAGAPDGLFRSVDGGLSWTRVYTVGSVAAVVSPTLLYAGGQIAPADAGCYTGYWGVARSEDGGLTWRMTFVGCVASLTIVAVHPQDPNIIYVGGSYVEGKFPLLLQSSDGGQTWTSLPLGMLASVAIYGLVLDPTRPDHLFASDHFGVWRSTDGGDTWQRLDTPPRKLPAEPHRLAVDSNGTTYAVSAYTSSEPPLYRSDDGGESWWVSLARLPGYVDVLVTDPAHPGRLYASPSGFGIFSSLNQGSSWQERNGGIRSPAAVNTWAIATNDPSVVYAGADKPRGGLFQSADGGLTWRQTLTDTPILAVAVAPFTSTIAYAGGPSGLYETLDGGRTWEHKLHPAHVSPVRAIAISPVSPTVAYAGGDLDYGGTHRGGFVFKRMPAAEGKMGWKQVNRAPVAFLLSLAADPHNPARVYVGGIGESKYGVVYRSEDSGTTWEEVLHDALWEVNALTLDPKHPHTVYAGTSGEGVYRSLDGGDTWEHWSVGLSGGEALRVYALAVDTLGVPYAATGDGVYRWDAEQTRWMPFGLQAQRTLSLASDQGSPRMLWAGTALGAWRLELPLWRTWLPLIRR